MTTTVLAYIPSPSQGVWQLGPVPLRAYALFIIVGIVAALMIGDRRWAARGGERGVIYDIALWAVPFGLIGGRLYHVITDWWRYFGEGGAGLAGVIRIWDGGLGIWGAVAFGGVGAWIACRRRGIPLPAFGDAIAPGIILAQGIGRLGNYFNQELYGRETTVPWGLEIYERRSSNGLIDNLNGVSTGEVLQVVHPTFLYELLWNLLVFAFLIYVDRRFTLGHGRLFAMYVAGYCLGRFWIELLRVDDATLIDGVRINSFTSTFVFIGAVVYIMVAPKGREDPAMLKGKAVSAEDVTEELAAVGATAGVVAAAKVAVDDEPTSEAASEAEKLTADVLSAPSEDIASAEEFAAEGEPEAAEEPDTESEAAAEAEELAEDVEEAPAEDIIEAQDFAEAKEDAETEAAVDDVDEGEELAAELDEAADAMAEEVAVTEAAGADTVEPEAGVGAVEGLKEAEPETDGDSGASDSDATGETAVRAVEADEAEEVNEAAEPDAGVGAAEGEAAVEGLEEAEDVAAEVHEGADEADEEAEPETDGDSGVSDPDATGETAVRAVEADEAEEVNEAAEPDAGVGAAEGGAAVEAEDVADEVHEGADEADEEAEPETDGDSGASDPDATGETAVTAVEADEAEEVNEAAEPDAGVGAAEGEAAVETEDVADEVHEGADEADEEAEVEDAQPEAGVGDVEDDDTDETAEANTEQDRADTEQSKTVSVESAAESGGRLRRWMRRRRRT
ncbi:prolipoprotein diacylglyceryl transferase [Mycolicibacterium sp. XJ879]